VITNLERERERERTVMSSSSSFQFSYNDANAGRVILVTIKQAKSQRWQRRKCKGTKTIRWQNREEEKTFGETKQV